MTKSQYFLVPFSAMQKRVEATLGLGGNTRKELATHADANANVTSSN